jgi:methionine-rich copper-binding protein CopC
MTQMLTRLLFILILTGSASLSWAHVHLVNSDPTQGSTVAAAPQKFVLKFAEPAKLTALSLQKDAEPAKKMGPLPASSAAEISIPAPRMAAGKYVLAWRAVSNDGHVMPGRVTFTVGQAK